MNVLPRKYISYQNQQGSKHSIWLPHRKKDIQHQLFLYQLFAVH